MKNTAFQMIIALLFIYNSGLAKEKTIKEKIEQLVKNPIIKEVVAPVKMKPEEKDYFNRTLIDENYRREALKQPPIIKLELQRITTKENIISKDSSYIATCEIVSLGTIIDGIEQIWSDEGRIIPKATIELYNKELKTLWKRYFDEVWINKVCNNGNVLLLRSAIRGDSTVYEVIDRKGNAVFTRTAEGSGMLGEKYSTYITDSGRYLRLHDWDTHVLLHYDLYYGDSIVIPPKEEYGTSFLNEDGSIEIYLENSDEVKWFYFPRDTLGKIRQ